MINNETESSITQQCSTFLKKLGFSKTVMVEHLFGTKGLLCAPPDCVSDDIKNLIRDFEHEQEQEKNAIDSVDKKLHKTQVELLQFMIEKCLEDQIKIYERKERNNVDSNISNERDR